MGSLVVQDHSSPTKPSKPYLKSKSTHLSDRFSESKSLDFSTWVSENTPKIFTFSLLALTVAAFFFLRNAANPAALLCLKTHRPNHPAELEYPEIHYNSIPPIVDKSSPYTSFRSDQWVVVSVSDYPSDSLRALVKIKGWQVDRSNPF